MAHIPCAAAATLPRMATRTQYLSPKSTNQDDDLESPRAASYSSNAHSASNSRLISSRYSTSGSSSSFNFGVASPIHSALSGGDSSATVSLGSPVARESANNPFSLSSHVARVAGRPSAQVLAAVASAGTTATPTTHLPSTAEVLKIRHVLLDADRETNDCTASERFYMLFLLAVTVILWPISPLLLVPFLGIRRTGVLLGNLGFLPQYSWLPAARATIGSAGRQWMSDRWGVFWLHHVTTALYAISMVAWAVDTGTAQGPSLVGGATGPAAVTRAMLGFQLLSTGAVLAARRLAFAAAIVMHIQGSISPHKVSNSFTEEDISPLFTVSSRSGRPDAVGITLHSTSSSSICTNRRLRIPYAPNVVRGHAYSAMHAYLESRGVEVLPPLAVLRVQPGAEVRLPSGHVVAKCLPVPPWRRVVLAFMMPGEMDTSMAQPRVPRGGTPQVDVACDSQLHVEQVLTIAPGLIGIAAKIFLFTVVAGLLSASLPWIVRASLPQLPSDAVAGSTPWETVAFVLLTVLDAMQQVNPKTNSSIFGAMAYYAGREFVQLVETNITLPVEASTASFVNSEADIDIEAGSVQPNVRVQYIPMNVNALVPPNLEHHIMEPAEGVRRRKAALEAMSGAVFLDTVVAVRSVMFRLRLILADMAPNGLGYDSTSLGFLTPRISILVSLTLAVLFSAAPHVISNGNNANALQLAALVPTCVMLLSFLNNAGLLLASFLAAGGIIHRLHRIHGQVLQWYMATSEVMSRYSARRAAILQHRRADRCGGDDDEAERVELIAIDSDLGEMSVLLDAQRGLLAYLTSAIEDSGGIRFLGMFRPGAASVGGLLAIMASAAVLGLRLATSVYGASLSS